MFLKKCDLISPKITLYYKGEKIHSSIFSGIITIIAYLSIFLYILYYIIGFINKKNPTIYYYNRYVNETGNFPLNSSSIFHYFHLINARGNNSDIEIKYNNIRITGIEKEIGTYIESYNLSIQNHWVYGPCDFETDAIGLNDLIDKNIFSQSACIKQYYDYKLKKFFNKNEEGFRWPILEHGASNPNRTLYGVLIEKCHNDSL